MMDAEGLNDWVGFSTKDEREPGGEQSLMVTCRGVFTGVEYRGS